jgi:hypothetical protein
MVPAVLLLCLALAADTTRGSTCGGAACATASDCGLLGDCIAERCMCDAGFTGSACTLPLLGLAAPPAENALFSHSSHSWGGKPIRNSDGKTWSLFAAEMTQHCPLSNFNNNSAIRRAVSASPGGPFRAGEIVFPPFAHNPTVTTAPDGTILLFYIGAPEHRQFNCSSSPDGPAAAHLASKDQHPDWKPQSKL